MGTICSTNTPTSKPQFSARSISSIGSQLSTTSAQTISCELPANTTAADSYKAITYFKKAKISLSKGDFFHAKEALENALKVDSQNFLALYTLAKMYFEADDIPTASLYTDKCLQINAKDVPTIILSAQINIRLVAYKKAHSIIQTAHQIDHNCKRTLIVYANLMELMNMNQKAVQLYSEMMRDTDYEDGAFLLCKIAYNLIKLGELDKAARYLDAAQRADYIHPLVCFVHIFMHFVLGDYKSCMIKCEEYSMLHYKVAQTNQSEILFLWAISYRHYSNHETSTEQVFKFKPVDKTEETSATYLQPMTSSRSLGRFSKYNLTHEHKQRVRSMQHIHERSSYGELNERAAIMKMKLQVHESFDKNLYDAVLLTASSEKPYLYDIVQYSLEYFADEKPENAIKLLESQRDRICVDLREHSAEKSLMIKLIRAAQENWSLKFDIAKIAYDLHGSFIEADLALVESSLHLNRLEVAREHIKNLDVYSSAYADNLFFKGLLHEKRINKVDKASINYYHECLQADPHNKRCFTRLLQYYLSMIDTYNMMKLYDSYLAHNEDKFLRYEYGMFLFERNMLTDAKSQFVIIVDLHSNYNYALRMVEKIDHLSKR